MTAADQEMPFSLDWLAGAAEKVPALSVCPDGHMVVNGNTHWSPTRISDDLRAIWFRMVTHERP